MCFSSPSEGHDYRDQPIAKGVYTMRYGLQPVNGDHLGVSIYRDYSLLLPAAKDQTPRSPCSQAARAAKRRIGRNEPSGGSASAGRAQPTPPRRIPAMIRDAEKNTWSVAVPLKFWSRARRSRSFSPFFSWWSERPQYDRLARLAFIRPSVADGTRCAARIARRPQPTPELTRGSDSTMMPVSLLIALLIAFGIEPPATGVPQADVVHARARNVRRHHLIASLAFGLGFWVAFRASHIGVVDLAGCATRYVAGRATAHVPLAGGLRLDHPFGRLVEAGPDQLGPGWSDSVDDVVVFLPFLLIQLLVWWGLFFAERALQIRQGIGIGPRRWADTWFSKGRQSLGLDPAGHLDVRASRDVIRRFFPGWEEYAAGEPIEMAVLGSLVLAISPLLCSAGLADSLLAAGGTAPAARTRGRPRRLSFHRHPRLGYRSDDGERLRDRHPARLSLCLAQRRLARVAHAARVGGGFRPRDRPRRPSPFPLLRLLLHGLARACFRSFGDCLAGRARCFRSQAG